MIKSSAQLKWLWISLGIVAMDQVAKQVAEAQLTPHQAVNLLPFFDWYLTYNAGAAFSLLADAGGWQRWLFTIIAIVISVVIVQWIRHRLHPGLAWQLPVSRLQHRRRRDQCRRGPADSEQPVWPQQGEARLSHCT